LVAGWPAERHTDVRGVDNRAGIKALVRHLVGQHGRTRLFYIAGPPEAPDARDRRSAFEEALAEHPGATLSGSFDGRFAAIRPSAGTAHGRAYRNTPSWLMTAI
jgi:DNA-binding LacI/PurR family transcriptional regulator